MMPTFPSPSLKFRTAGFPRYGFKASLSGRACPPTSRLSLLPACPPPPPVCLTLRPLPRRGVRPGSVSRAPRASTSRCARGLCPSTPGVLGSGPSCVVSVHHRVLRPHPPVSPARGDFTALPLIRRAFAVRERLGDPRDLPYFPCRAFHTCRRPYAGGSAAPPVVSGTAMPGFLVLRPSRHPRDPSLPAIPDGVVPFGAASFAFMLRPACLPGPPDWLRRDGATCAPTSPSEVPCHPRFWRRPSPAAAGGQARWANGKPPLVGTFTRPVTAASEAAQLCGLELSLK